MFKISFLTYKILRGGQPVYLHFMLAPSLPSRSLRSNKGISLSVPRVKTNTGARAFALVPRLFRTTWRCLSVQPFQLLPSRHTSLTWPFPHRHGTPDSPLMPWNCVIDFAVETDSVVMPLSLASPGILAL